MQHTLNETIHYDIDKSKSRKLTTSLHFLIVSRFPRLSTAFRALAEKLRDASVSDKFTELGHTLTIIKVFEFPPAEIQK